MFFVTTRPQSSLQQHRWTKVFSVLPMQIYHQTNRVIMKPCEILQVYARVVLSCVLTFINLQKYCKSPKSKGGLIGASGWADVLKFK